MSFTGDLEHMPIVDVIQLLHSTRKTGTLCLRSRKGESQLVFNDGYIVSANHVNTSVRVGRILVEMGVVTADELDEALLEQKGAGAGRKPLIASLIERGRIGKEDAYKGLESLIEMTIVEVLTWTSGTFSLDVERMVVSDEYRYFPETLHQDFFLNTQSVLMDALRIFDEKMRDGALTEDTFPETGEEFGEIFGEEGEGTGISVEELGLADVEAVPKRIPDIFVGLRDENPLAIHRREIGAELTGFPVEEQEKFLSFLAGFSGPARTAAPQAAPALALIMFGSDKLLAHAVTTVFRHEGFFVFTTDDEVNLDPIIDQSHAKGLIPILVIDSPVKDDRTFSAERLALLQGRKLGKYPRIPILQLASPLDREFSRQALKRGVRAVLPVPVREEPTVSFVEEAIDFLETLRSYLFNSFADGEQQVIRRFRDCVIELDSVSEPQEVSYVLLRVVSTFFERSLTFVVGKSELIAERGIGIKGEKSAGTTPPLKLRISRDEPGVFHDAVESGRLFYGQVSDAPLQRHLYPEIGAPFAPTILLLPIKSQGRVIALIYGDFGPKSPSEPRTELLEVLMRHAELVLANGLYRKHLARPARPA